MIPFHGRHPLFARCLESVGKLDPQPAELVVVCDDDGEPHLEIAGNRNWRVLSTGQRSGPAVARNLGVGAVKSEVVLFIDADVVVPSDIVGRVRQLFAGRPDAAAAFGSYDHHPRAQGLVSRYKNLLHHWTHQHASEEATTFWTGCGAIRRQVFLEMGGFDPSQRWLEDVELGYRLHAAGHRIVLDRSLEVTHLKRWTLTSLLVSDVFHRALPWTELVSRYRLLPRDLNTDSAGRISGGLAVTALLSLVGLVYSPWFGTAAVAAVAGLVWLNLGLYRFFGRRGGRALMCVGVPLHWAYLAYGTIGFAAGTLWWRTVGTRKPTTRSPMTGAPTVVATVADVDQPVGADHVSPDGSRPRAPRRSA